MHTPVCASAASFSGDTFCFSFQPSFVTTRRKNVCESIYCIYFFQLSSFFIRFYSLSLDAAHDDDDLKAPQRENGTKADVNLPIYPFLRLHVVRLVLLVFLTVQSISGRMSLFRRREFERERERNRSAPQSKEPLIYVHTPEVAKSLEGGREKKKRDSSTIMAF